MPEPALTELEPGVVRVTMPLPWALDHVHCYAVDDAEGWTLIDCGLGTPGTGALGAGALDCSAIRPCAPRDHALPPRSHRREHAPGRAHGRRRDRAGPARPRADGRRVDRSRVASAFRALPASTHGMPAEVAERSATRRTSCRSRRSSPTRLVDEGDTLDLAGEPFDMLVLPGHADGHIVLLGAAQRPHVRRRRAARRDHAQRRPLGGQRPRSAGPLPADAAAHRRSSRRRWSTPATAA